MNPVHPASAEILLRDAHPAGGYHREAPFAPPPRIEAAETVLSDLAATLPLRIVAEMRPAATADDPAPGSIIAIATSHEELMAACRARRHELGLAQIVVDEIAGLQTGYTGKLECGDKGLGRLSLPLLLGALGLELVVVRTAPHHERQRRVNAQGTGGRADASNRVRTAA